MKTKLLKRLRKETKDSFSVSIKNGFYFIHDTHVSRGNDIMIWMKWKKNCVSIKGNIFWKEYSK